MCRMPVYMKSLGGKVGVTSPNDAAGYIRCCLVVGLGLRSGGMLLVEACSGYLLPWAVGCMGFVGVVGMGVLCFEVVVVVVVGVILVDMGVVHRLTCRTIDLGVLVGLEVL